MAADINETDNNETADRAIVKRCYTMFYLLVSSEHTSEIFGTVQWYFKLLADIGRVRCANMGLR